MVRESFIFYRSFMDACEFLSEEDKAKYMYIVTKYGLDGIIAEDFMEGNNMLQALFALTKPQIDANNKKFTDGLKGGRPKKVKTKKPVVSENKTSGYENEKPVVSELKNHSYETKKPNVNVNANVNENENINDNAKGVSAGTDINDISLYDIGIKPLRTENMMRFVNV